MSLLDTITKEMIPVMPVPEKKSRTTDTLRGFMDPSIIFGTKNFTNINEAINNRDRRKIIKLIKDMANDGAVADKALDKLCEDATCNEIKIDAPKRRKNIIAELLKRVNYQDVRKELIYLFLAHGDRFIQLEYTKASTPGKIAYITDLIGMPVLTMLRNTNEMDQFSSPANAFAQVTDISNGYLLGVEEWFSWPKIIHARNDWEISKEMNDFVRYGRSSWMSGIRVFNMFMMLLEDSAIMRHENSNSLRLHRVGAESQMAVDSEAVDDYAVKVGNQLSNRSTDVFIGGTTKVEELGGTKNVMSSVEDIMMALSILSIAIDYPIDLLSGMVKKTASGEELFRKEIVVKRAIKSIIKKENKQILRPMIDRELMLQGSFGDYNITTDPASFEDETKRSKRGLGEVAALAKSLRTFHNENNDDRSWEEERTNIEDDVAWMELLAQKYPDGVKAFIAALGRTDPQAGAQGDSKDKADQQVRKTPGSDGTDDGTGKTGGEE
jgi:hypothetical protein